MMSLTDDLVDMLKDIFESDLEVFQKCHKAIRLLSMIKETNKESCELVGGKSVDGF